MPGRAASKEWHGGRLRPGSSRPPTPARIPSSAFFPAPAKAPEVVVLKAARLFDGRGDSTVANGVVIVEDGKIKAAMKGGRVFRNDG